MSFSKLGLCDPILNAIADLAYSVPTAIQQQAIPVVLSGKDLIAARGLDIGELARVVNYDLPDKVDDYIHRIGRTDRTDRTDRTGASGEAISFVAKDNFRNLCAIESHLGHVIVRKEFDGFAVKKMVPVSILNYVPKNKRPQEQT